MKTRSSTQAVPCLRFPPSARAELGKLLAAARPAELLFGLLFARGFLVQMLRPKRTQLAPSDVLLVMNTVGPLPSPPPCPPLPPGLALGPSSSLPPTTAASDRDPGCCGARRCRARPHSARTSRGCRSASRGTTHALLLFCRPSIQSSDGATWREQVQPRRFPLRSRLLRRPRALPRLHHRRTRRIRRALGGTRAGVSKRASRRYGDLDCG